MRKKKLIVFDIDGTLTDSVVPHQKAFTEMLFEMGVLDISSEYKTFKHHTDTFIAKEIYETDQKKQFTAAQIVDFENGLTKKISSVKINEIKGAKRLIEQLENETNFGICFATGSLRRPAEYKLKSIGINFHDNQLVASNCMYEREKIVTEAIEQAAQYYDVIKFERIISVGDGLWDLVTAQQLGLEFIGIGLKNKKVLIENGAETVYNDLTEFELK